MLTFRTAKNLCPNLQKPPLPSKIPGYAPAKNKFFTGHLWATASGRRKIPGNYL